MNQPPRVSNWNIANQVTAARLLVSVALFVALHWQAWGISLALFVLGATTDWVDGYLARSRNVVTQLGRILDPLADKIIICGTYVFLAAVPTSGIAAWMAVTILVRELVVTVLRSFLEQNGKDFSAKMPGKIKMVLQCAAAIASLLLLTLTSHGTSPAWLATATTWLAWLMVASTLQSGLGYVIAALDAVRNIDG